MCGGLRTIRLINACTTGSKVPKTVKWQSRGCQASGHSPACVTGRGTMGHIPQRSSCSQGHQVSKAPARDRWQESKGSPIGQPKMRIPVIPAGTVGDLPGLWRPGGRARAPLPKSSIDVHKLRAWKGREAKSWSFAERAHTASCVRDNTTMKCSQAVKDAGRGGDGARCLGQWSHDEAG